MKPRTISISALLVVLAPAAFALNSRSAVSVDGLDTNPCTVASPCRSFTTAIPATAPGGEVIALTTAGYGPFTVNNTMTISGAPGVHAAITATSGDGITVAVSSTDSVNLRNLVLIGAGGFAGIDLTIGGELQVSGCLVRGFTAYGIVANTYVASKVSIDDTVLLDSAFGVSFAGDFSGATFLNATVTNSSMVGNDFGIKILRAKVVVAHNTIAYSGTSGVDVDLGGGTGLIADATLESNSIVNNSTGVSVNCAGVNNQASVWLSQNVVAFNTIQGVAKSGTATAYTFNNNRFVANAIDGGPFTTALAK
jgi:hypothetical protein